MMFPSAKEATKRAFTVAAGTRPSVNQLRETPAIQRSADILFLVDPPMLAAFQAYRIDKAEP